MGDSRKDIFATSSLPFFAPESIELNVVYLSYIYCIPELIWIIWISVSLFQNGLFVRSLEMKMSIVGGV